MSDAEIRELPAPWANGQRELSSYRAIYIEYVRERGCAHRANVFAIYPRAGVEICHMAVRSNGGSSATPVLWMARIMEDAVRDVDPIDIGAPIAWGTIDSDAMRISGITDETLAAEYIVRMFANPWQMGHADRQWFTFAQVHLTDVPCELGTIGALCSEFGYPLDEIPNA